MLVLYQDSVKKQTLDTYISVGMLIAYIHMVFNDTKVVVKEGKYRWYTNDYPLLSLSKIKHISEINCNVDSQKSF